MALRVIEWVISAFSVPSLAKGLGEILWMKISKNPPLPPFACLWQEKDYQRGVLKNWHDVANHNFSNRGKVEGLIFKKFYV